MSPLGPPDPIQGGSADIWTHAPPSQSSPHSGSLPQTNLGSGAQPAPATQTTRLQHGRRTSLLPSPAGQRGRASTVSAWTPVLRAPQPTLAFGVGRRETRRPVREPPEPRRERRPARNRKASVCVLSQSESLSRMPTGSRSVASLSSWTAKAPARRGPDLNVQRESPSSCVDVVGLADCRSQHAAGPTELLKSRSARPKCREA